VVRLAYAEMSGFRGFRDRVRMEFGTGFTIICGRNGVGKSTVFDCVEYALTGRIDKYEVEKAAKESWADYIWWRGEGAASSHYVKVGLVRDDGQLVEVERSREQGATMTPDAIETLLCGNGKPDDALTQLCKTSIIRDEWIAALSVDLKDTDRFDLVRSALGPAEGADLLTKAKGVITACDARLKQVEGQYANVRNQLALLLSQAAELRDTINKAGDLSSALMIIESEVPDAPTETVERLEAARAFLAKRRRDLGAMHEAADMAHKIADRRAEFYSDAAKANRIAAQAELEAAKALHEQMQASLRIAETEYLLIHEANKTAAMLLELVDDGARLGLNNGHCPLCDAARTQAEYEGGMVAARQRVAAMSAELESAQEAVNRATEAAVVPAQRLAAAEARSSVFKSEELLITSMESSHIEHFQRHGLSPALAADPDGMDAANERERVRLLNLEGAVRSLEASQGVSQLAGLEDRISRVRIESDMASKVVSRAQDALAAAKGLERSVKRVSGEVIDERLAQISPLLNELYQRLRPHADWQTIDYSIRGDVRRFLSLRVGDDLNPQFVFSSGQRRAAGLAFLLSVHLSRSWTNWRSLLLDDPVQHIDDFRALQLTEVLAALRVDGRQVICAVEDSALADLLCRRLAGSGDGEGRRVDLDILPSASAGISLDRPIGAVPAQVLRQALPNIA
jgi:chromosome segregation protein